MKLSTLMSWSDAFTDETQTSVNVLAYANEAIAIVNTKFSLTLPFITSVDEEYTALPQNWFVRFLLNYLNYGVKMNDASLSEASEYKNKFMESLYDFSGVNKKAVIDALYIDSNLKAVFVMDTTNAINVGWFGQSDSEWTGW